MYNKHHLEVGKIASKSSIKPELQSIAFFGDKVLATDSFRAIEYTVPQGERLEKPVMLNAKLVRKRVKMDKYEELSVEDIRRVARLEPTEGTYPEVEKIMKDSQKNECITISVNGRYLAEIASLLCGFNKFDQVVLKIPTQQGKPILLEAKGKEGDMEGRGLIMPMNR